jgi:hypothetical protein
MVEQVFSFASLLSLGGCLFILLVGIIRKIDPELAEICMSDRAALVTIGVVLAIVDAMLFIR